LTEQYTPISDELTALLRKLVSNGSIRIAGTLLYVYFIRNWKINDELAAYYVTRYFQKYYSTQFKRYQQK
jgi:hypothetical protein